MDIPDDSSHIFTVLTSEEQKHQFRAKSRAEMYLWEEAIRKRAEACADNDIILMAEQCCSQAERVGAERDMDLLLNCSTFEGTLRNRCGHDNVIVCTCILGI